MTTENISRSISMKECSGSRIWWGLNPPSPDHQSAMHLTEPLRPASGAERWVVDISTSELFNLEEYSFLFRSL